MHTTETALHEAEPPFIRQKDIAARFGISRATQHRLRRLGILPEGIRIGPRTIIYSEARVIEAISQLASLQKPETSRPTLKSAGQSNPGGAVSSEHGG